MIVPTYLELRQTLANWHPDAQWTNPRNAQHGLFTSTLAFRTVKAERRKPNEVMPQLTRSLNAYLAQHQLDGLVELKEMGLYLNLFLTPNAFVQLPALVKTQPLVLPEPTTVMLEYISSNVAKRLHAGHMRNANIGEAMRRVLKLKYADKLITDNHWGDWGVQFGILIWGYKRQLDEAAYQADPVGELQRIYVWSNAQKDIAAHWDTEVRQEFVLLEQGDPENRALWEEFVRVSRIELDAELPLLNITPTDLQRGESSYEGVMAELTEFLEREQLWQVEGLARYFDLGQLDSSFAHFGRCYLISSGGYTTYAYRDVAARLEWSRAYGIERAITLTDLRQSHNFDQAFSIISYLSTLPAFKREFGDDVATRLGRDNLVHVGYGRLALTTGSMSTRTGNVLRLRDVVDTVTAASAKQIMYKNPDLTSEQVQKRASVVAIASLKWADLNRDPTSDVTLDPNLVTAFEGNTGTYQLYTYARLKSILRKANPSFTSAYDPDHSTYLAAEESLLCHLYRFPEVVETAAKTYRINLICEHLSDLTALTSKWYETTPILSQEQPQRQAALLVLVETIAQQIATGLNLLAIDVLEEL